MVDIYTKLSKIVWLFFSILISILLLLSFLPVSGYLISLIPESEWKAHYTKECPFCGMTTSFLLITQGNFKQVVQSNSRSLYLFSLMVFNQLLLTKIVIQKIRLFRKIDDRK